jgi:hypothetical protein
VRAIGELPAPAPVESLPRVALPRNPSDPLAQASSSGRESPRTLLARAACRIDDSIRPLGRRPLPRWALALLPPVGAVLAAMASLVAAGLVTFGGTGIWGGSVLRGLGWVTFVAAPSVGVPIAALVARRRLRARLDVGGVGLTLLGGMVAATLISLAFAGSH